LDARHGTKFGPAVIDLSLAPGEGQAWDRSKATIYLWAICELIFVTNPWQVSSKLRVAILRMFGAEIGSNVIFRPRSRVKFPWKLAIGDNSWIGEGVWLHNQDQLTIGGNVVVSQEVFITNGSHAHRRDMALLTRPVIIEDGAWLTTRCIVLGGAVVGESSLVTPGTVVNGRIPPNTIWGSIGAGPVGLRFGEG
jgi:putative colanic acid biosynthesis acetyltransferase WcaF